MPFTCTRCGSCCMHLGDYIVIEKEISPVEFIGCCVSTGTPFHARVDDDKRDLFTDRSWIAAHPRACPFLRPSGDGIICTIHETGPAQCRAYRCVVMRISSPHGDALGTVTGTLALHSSDRALRLLWDEIQPMIPCDEDKAEERIRALLEEKGYRCV